MTATYWPRWREITPEVGLQCFSCNRRAELVGTSPTRYLEVLCGEAPICLPKMTPPR